MVKSFLRKNKVYMKLIVPFFLLFLASTSCNTDTTAEKGRLNLVSDAFSEAQLPYKERDVQLTSIHLRHPNFVSSKFQSLMHHLVMHDTIGVYCTEQENLNVEYRVKHFSKSLLCFQKEVRVKCPMGNKSFQLKEIQTYFLKNDSIYEVKFAAHADFKKHIVEQLAERKLRLCTAPNMDQLQFMIRKGKPFVGVTYSYPLCDTLMPFVFEKNTLKVNALELVKLD